MDGLLINSEDLYTKVTNEILHEYGRPNLPWSLKAQLQGRTRTVANELFLSWAQLPISSEEFFRKQGSLQAKYFPFTELLPGVVSLLASLREAGISVALASSSTQHNFALKTSRHTQLFDEYFPRSCRVLGDDARVADGRGKPAPDIYLVALGTVNAERTANGEAEIKPEECLVFEDAVPGVEAGRRAGMRVIWCPHPELLKEYKGKEGDVLAGNLGEHDETNDPNQTADKEPQTSGMKGWPGAVGDGWGELVESLEQVDLKKYGIGRA